jgi:hypothetical protein
MHSCTRWTGHGEKDVDVADEEGKKQKRQRARRRTE